MQQTQCFRKEALDILYKLQILYQNNQIDAETKDKIASLVKDSLSNDDFVKQLSVELTALKRVVDVEFKDIILECLNKIN